MRSWVIAAALLGASACSKQAAPPTGPTDQYEPGVRYIAGERAQWELRWLNVVMGRLTMAVGQPGEMDGQPAITVRMEAATAGVLAKLNQASSELAAVLNLQSGLAIRTSGNIDGLFTGSVTRPGFKPRHPGLRWRRYWQRYFLEPLGTIGALRAAWKGQLGELGYVPVSLRGRRYHLEMTARRRERILSRQGPVAAIRIEGVLRQVRTNRPLHHAYVVWISDDPRQIPIRAHIQSGWVGTVEAELVHYSRPASGGTPVGADRAPSTLRFANLRRTRPGAHR